MNAFPRWLVAVLGLTLLALSAGGAWFYSSQGRNIRQQVESDLQIVARLKVQAIADWRANQLAEAAELSSNRQLANQIRQWLAQPSDKMKEEICDQLRGLQTHYSYTDVFLVDATGTLRLSLGGRAVAIAERTADRARESLKSGRPLLTELDTENGSDIFLDAVAPVFCSVSNAPVAVAAVLLRNDPARFLFPLIRSWPTSSQTAETLLVRRDGASVLFLNELRHQQNTALRLRIPITATIVPAVMAVLGKQGVVKGKDYRGVDVLAVLAEIPNSTWQIVAKIDASEAYAGWRFRAALIIFLIVTWILLLGVGVLVVWQRNAKVHYRALAQAEAKRLQLEERHRITLMSIGDAVIATDTAGRVEMLNPMAETLTGWKNAEAQGKALEEVFRIISEATRQPIENPVRQVVREGKVVGLANHTSLIARDLTERPIADAAAPILNRNGAITGMVLIFRDQTQERQVQRELLDSKARLDFALQSAQMGAWHWDIRHDKRFFDPQTCTILGIAPQTFTGAEQDFFDHVLAEDRGALKAAMTRTLKDDIPYEVEYRVIWPDGGTRSILSRGRLVRDDHGQPQCISGILWDVTERRKIAAERKRAEEVIRQSQAELEAIYDATPIMLCLVNQIGQIERMNRAMAEFVGRDPVLETPIYPGELLGCGDGTADSHGCGLGAGCESCVLRTAIMNTFRTGESSRQVEITFTLDRDGEQREVRGAASTALVRLREASRVLLCMEDVTHRRQLEAQLLHSQKMDAIGQLAGGVAHDFNNILAAMLLHLQLLQQENELNESVVASLRELENGAYRASSLTRQLLLFSRRQVVQMRRLEFNGVIQGMMDMLTRLLGEHINIKVDLSSQNLWLEADSGMLEQVLMNLCVNSRDAMPRGGRLDLKTELLKLDAAAVDQGPDSRSGQFVCLTVADTGVGMDETTLKKIFEPFFTTKQPGKGTGLGLATVYGIVHQHKGWVEVSSAVGLGTSFRVLLPATAPLAAVEAVRGPADVMGGSETILVVEDDAFVRRLVRRTLTALGYTVLEATNGVEALGLWENQHGRIDLLFTDMVMPDGLTGLDLAKQARQSKPGLKIVISSGYSADLLKEEQVPADIKFLSKPYPPQLLAKTIRDCLDSE